jgi:hypothetical protein
MAARSGESVRVDCKVLRETDRAIEIEYDEGNRLERCWLPLSQVSEIHKQDGYVVISDWIARTKGLA